MHTTLNEIIKHEPCASGWQTLLEGLNKSVPDDEPLTFTTIFNINGINDTIWVLTNLQRFSRELRLFACHCAKQVIHLMEDERSIKAIAVSELFANGLTTKRKLRKASARAYSAAYPAGAYAARAAAAAAADDVVNSCAYDAAYGAVFAAAHTYATTYDVVAYAASIRRKQNIEFKRMLECIDNNVKYNI